ncbi:hypothetical protein GQ600_19907 [Phytophthora cactorum]|nr:hypothetical protein GQ600_19907 [Phytophthora cactorum]
MNVQAAVKEAIALRRFPPSISLPGKEGKDMLSLWFKVPTFTWAPET